MANDENSKRTVVNTHNNMGNSIDNMEPVFSPSGGHIGVDGNNGFCVIPDSDKRLLEHIIGCYVAWHAEMSVCGRISDAEKMVMAPIMDAANLMLIKLKTYGSTNQ